MRKKYKFAKNDNLTTMKLNRIFSLIMLLFLLSAGNIKARKVIRYPMFDRTQTPIFKIDSISLDIDETLLYFHYDNRVGACDWINISENTYVKDDRGNKLYITSVENIEKHPGRTDIRGHKDWNCILHFPQINSQCVDFIEKEGAETSFSIYGIDLTCDGEFVPYPDFDELNRKLNIIDFYFSSENYEKCIELITPCLSPIRFSLGKDLVCQLLGKLIDAYVLLGRKDDAYEKYIEEYRQLCKKMGIQDVDHLNCSLELRMNLIQTGNTVFELENQNKIEEARELLSEYLSKAELVYEKNDSILIFEKIHYANLCIQKNNSGDALYDVKNMLEENKRLCGVDDLYDISMERLAIKYTNEGDLERANECYSELYRLQDATSKKYTSFHARVGYCWGSLHNNQNAINIFEDSYQLYENPEMIPDTVLYNLTFALSLSYYEEENFDKSVQIWEHTIQMLKDRVGRNNVLYFNSIVSLAERNRMIGHYGKALESIYEINEELQTLDLTLDHVKGLGIYAKILRDVGENEKALTILGRTKEIYEKYNLIHDIDYADLLLDMANLYENIPDSINCINTCRSVISGVFDTHYDKDLGVIPVNADYLKLYAKVTLARLFLNEDPAHSAKLLKEVICFDDKDNSDINDPKESAIRLIKHLYSKNQDNNIVAEIYKGVRSEVDNLSNQSDLRELAINDLTLFLKSLEKIVVAAVDECNNEPGLTNAERSESYERIVEEKVKGMKHLIHTDVLQTMFDDFKKQLLFNTLFLTEEQRDKYLQSGLKMYFDPMVLAIICDITKIEELNNIIYDYLLLTKSVRLATYMELNDIIYKSNDNKLIELYETVKARLSKSNDKPLVTSEYEIIKKSRELSDFTKNLKISWQDVKTSLNENEVALEFYVNPNEVGNNYGVLILRNNWENPKFKNLALIDAAIEDYGFERMSNIWILLIKEGYIKTGDTVYMSGAGVFQTKYFEHLEIEPGVYFSDICNVVRVTSTREIVRRNFVNLPQAGSIVLFGGLDYNNGEMEEPQNLSSETHLFRGEGDERYRAGFDELVYSQKEIDAISDIAKNYKLKCLEYNGEKGTEQEVRNLSGENLSVLHFATHGLYYPESSSNMIENSPYMQLFNNNDCLNRSFLVMSGGNALPQRKYVTDSMNDGLLTASEISRIDFHNVNLVVLSACQSAKGDISNEGVLGLQYGFKKAGVNSILMCLDNVDDKATQILMVEFYKSLLSGKSKRESLKNAQKYLRTTENGKYSDPKYWASFILLDALD